MRKTHGFLNQDAGLNVQVAAMTEEAARDPGSSSKQQVEAPLESQENPKRRKRSDDEYKNPTNHYLDTTAKPTKNNTEPTNEYTKPDTTTIPLSDTPASGDGDEALLTANETRTTQALDTIPVEPVKRPEEDEDKFAEQITTARNLRGSSGMRTMMRCVSSPIRPLTSCVAAYASMFRRSRGSGTRRPCSIGGSPCSIGGSRAPGVARTASRWVAILFFGSAQCHMDAFHF